MGMIVAKVNQKISFDVILDGEYHHRVKEGLLFEKRDDSLLVRVACNKETIFETMKALMEFIVRQDLEKEFEEYLANESKEE